jgi:hypothetical protein
MFTRPTGCEDKDADKIAAGITTKNRSGIGNGNEQSDTTTTF